MTGAAPSFNGARLRADRRRAKMKREELAARVRVSGRTVSNWENGKSTPGTAEQMLLCDALNERLFNGNQPVSWRSWWSGVQW